MKNNYDEKTVKGFGDEWQRFDQSMLPEEERLEIFNKYFKIFPWDKISKTSEGFDLGCGSGRWAQLVSPLVGKLHCVDPSLSLEVAKKNLNKFKNCEFHSASVDGKIFDENSMDFGYSLGVLHHVPDTKQAIKDCVLFLKPGAPLLIYLYFSFDNKSYLYKVIWSLSNILRVVISRCPYKLRYILSQLIAALIYWPLARFSLFLDKFNISNRIIEEIPLSFYRDKSFYTMRTDALDRFGTRLEKRFSKKEIENMMLESGLENIEFSNSEPFWCAIGIKKKI